MVLTMIVNLLVLRKSYVIFLVIFFMGKSVLPTSTSGSILRYNDVSFSSQAILDL